MKPGPGLIWLNYVKYIEIPSCTYVTKGPSFIPTEMSFIPIWRLTGTISSELIGIDCLAIHLKDSTGIQKSIFL